MKKLDKKDIRNIGFICLIPLLYFLWAIIRGDVYGSLTDFMNQHIRIPEYLRMLTLNTHNILPSLALHLGGGQNIFYLVYHGFLNPILMLSFLVPWMDMKNFVVISNVVIVILDIILMYRFIYHKYDSRVAVITTLLFTLASPIVYHTHRHYMFTNYMPFVILAMIYTDRYFESGRRLGLVISLVMIIFISYLYSVGALVAVTIYAIHRYMRERKINIRDFIRDGANFALNIILAIGLSSVILLPTMYVVLHGGRSGKENLDMISLLIPSLSGLYSSYSLGLGSFMVWSLLRGIKSKKKEMKFLGIILSIILVVPGVNFLLNGGMYIDAKSLIPFLPLYVLLMADVIDEFRVTKGDVVILGILGLILWLCNWDYDYGYIFVIDMVILIGSLVLYLKKKKMSLVLTPVILISGVTFAIVNNNDKLMARSNYEIIERDNEIAGLIKDNGFYRTANLLHRDMNVNNVLNINDYGASIYTSLANNNYTMLVREVFRNEIVTRDYHTITDSDSILFNVYMGNRYLIGDRKFLGYDLVRDNGDSKLYVNDRVFAMGYATPKVMSRREFDSLEYPYTVDAILNYVIVDNDVGDVYESKISKYNGMIEMPDWDRYRVNDGYVMDIDNREELEIRLDEGVRNKMVILTFDMKKAVSCEDSTRAVSRIMVNGTENVLSCATWKYYNGNDTFHYVIAGDDNNNILKVTLDKGHYEIDNMQIYVMDSEDVFDIKHDDVLIDGFDGSNITGTVNVQSDGYLMFSIPYDEGFKIFIDDEEEKVEMVDTAMIGTKIKAGYHKIRVNYEVPYLKQGLLLSGISGIILIGVIRHGRKNKKC